MREIDLRELPASVQQALMALEHVHKEQRHPNQTHVSDIGLALMHVCLRAVGLRKGPLSRTASFLKMRHLHEDTRLELVVSFKGYLEFWERVRWTLAYHAKNLREEDTHRLMNELMIIARDLDEILTDHEIGTLTWGLLEHIELLVNGNRWVTNLYQVSQSLFENNHET